MLANLNLNNILIERFVAEELKRQKEARPIARFLDIGCGDLRYKRYSDKSGWETVFGDLEQRADRITVVFDAHSIPFKEGCFDVVLMTEVLEHLAHPERSLRDIARIMKHGGILILTVPFILGMHEIPFDYFRYTEFGLVRMLSDAGFELVYFQRRADFIGACLLLLSDLYNNAVEFCLRKPYLRPIGANSSAIGKVFGCIAFASYLYIFDKRISVRHERPGDDLKGVGGKFNLWPLGFNLVCRKI